MNRIVLELHPDHSEPWNPKKYYVDNLLLGLALAVTTQLLLVHFVGMTGYGVWVMMTSLVHFLISYLFHYNVLQRTLTTRKKQFTFFFTFLPLVVLFPLIYYSDWVPRSLATYLFMVYFLIHLVRDEHFVYVQRSSSFRQFTLNNTLQYHTVFIILALSALLYGNYVHAISPQLERESIFRYIPVWTFYAFLLVLTAWGIGSAYFVYGKDMVILGRMMGYTLLVVCSILFFYRVGTPLISVSEFNYLLIYYHNIAWFIFGIERILSTTQKTDTTGNHLRPASPTDPFRKFKQSIPHFLGLILGIYLFLSLLYGLSQLEPFRFLTIMFHMKYMPLWAFPHITMHFYPKK